jgi:hypothetical protein
MRLQLTGFALALTFVAMGAPGTAGGATLTATPATFHAVVARAKGGDTIVLARGDYRGVRLTGQAFKPNLVIDAGAGTFHGLELRGVQGLSLRGGVYRLPPTTTHPRDGRTVFGQALRMDNVHGVEVVDAQVTGPGVLEPDGPYGEGYGVFVVRSNGVSVLRSQFRGFKSAIVLSKVADFKLVSNQFRAMRSDGIQAGESRRGLIEDNDCADTRIRDQEHPDCIQLWSRPTAPPTADIVIRGNRAVGTMQGAFLGNHVRDGVDDGGFDRILIENNVFDVGYPNGISISDGRNSIVRNNKVTTFAGARWRASINVRGVGASTVCGNSVKAAAGKPGIQDSPCAD